MIARYLPRFLTRSGDGESRRLCLPGSLILGSVASGLCAA